jgi:multidrug efflux pump subunit AcrA (membrane-fusion protein)
LVAAADSWRWWSVVVVADSAAQVAPARRTRTRGAPGGAPPSGAAQSAGTIDALFAPLPPVESRGRVWTFADKQLKPVDVRLGITDGTFTELLDGESLSAETQVVTGMTGPRDRRTGNSSRRAGNPFQQGGRGGRGGRGGF